MLGALLRLAVFLGCSLGLQPEARAATLDVTSYGACSGCASSTNRTGVAAAIAAATAGDTIYFPDGTYTFDVASLRAILANKALTFHGQSKTGTILRIDVSLTGGVGTFWRIFEVTASNVTIENMTLDGQKPGSGGFTPYDPNVEHHAGLFVGPSITDFTFQDVVISNFEGDCLQIYSGVVRPTVARVDFRYCQRSGMSYTPTNPALPVQDGIVHDCTFVGVSNQPIDNEHGPVIGAEIYNNNIGLGLNDYNLTISGYTDGLGDSNRSKNYHVHHNTFAGGIFVIRAEDALIENNTFNNTSTKPCVEISRSAKGIVVQNNTCIMSQSTTASVAAFAAIGTTENRSCTTDADCDQSAGSTCVGATSCTPVYAYPTDITFHQNVVQITGRADSFGVRAEAVDTLTVTQNDFLGFGTTAAAFAAVYLRSTICARTPVLAVVKQNRIRNFGQRGVSMQGNLACGQARWQRLEVIGNWLGNTATGGPQTQGVVLDDNTNVLQQAVVRDNTKGCGTTTLVSFGTAKGIDYSASPFTLTQACP
jgi:hypothetical protein